MEKTIKKNVCVCVCNWITLLYSRKYNIVNQLYFKKKKNSPILFFRVQLGMISGVSCFVSRDRDKALKQHLF